MPRSALRSDQWRDSALQLPVACYVDPAFLELEKRSVFDAASTYVGHASMVPERGSFHVIDWLDDAWMLVRNRDGDRDGEADGDGDGPGIELVSNVCRHRQAVMYSGQGTARNVVCPIHRWSYDLHGRQQAAPHFSENPCLSLPTRRLQEWNGLLFQGPRDVAADLSEFSKAAAFDYSGYVHHSTVIDEYSVNWKTFLEIYLELYHVEPFHSGLKGYADCGAFEPADWEFGETWSNQVITLRSDTSRASEAYQRYYQLVTDFRGHRPEHAALWFCHYPSLMLEWYPEALAVSFLIPKSPSTTLNVVDYFYPADVLAERPEIVEAHQAAYNESAEEDRQIVERIDRGRRALYAQDIDDRGPYQEPLEDGMVHFHRWLRGQIAAFETEVAAPLDPL